MGHVYFIADTHFGVDAIRRYENRPFPDTAAMDETIIRNWNETVTAQDEVFLLGDFGGYGCEQEILSRLNGTKYLVKGNHDTASNSYYRSCGFAEVYDYPILYDNFWLLSHEALYINTNMPYANLFGHVHNNPIVRDFSSQHFCVCVERIQYTPIRFDRIRQAIKEAAEQ